MEMILSYLFVTGCAMFTAWELARYYTEVRRPLLNFKPFNCRPCFTFWATFLIITICLINTPLHWALCLAGSTSIALINYLLIKSKSKIYE